jgi:hypothetical protein
VAEAACGRVSAELVAAALISGVAFADFVSEDLAAPSFLLCGLPVPDCAVVAEFGAEFGEEFAGVAAASITAKGEVSAVFWESRIFDVADVTALLGAAIGMTGDAGKTKIRMKPFSPKQGPDQNFRCRKHGIFLLKMPGLAKKSGHELPSAANSAALRLTRHGRKSLVFQAGNAAAKWHGVCDIVCGSKASGMFRP